MAKIGSAVAAAGWQLHGIDKPQLAQCHRAELTASSTVAPYGSVPARRGATQAVSGVRREVCPPSKVYPVLHKVYHWMYKALPPLSIMPLVDWALPASGIFSKLPVPTSSPLLVS